MIDWLIITGDIPLPSPHPRRCIPRIPALCAPSCWRAAPCWHLSGKTTGSRREFVALRGWTRWWLWAAPSILDPASLRLQSPSEQRSLLHWSQCPGKARHTHACTCSQLLIYLLWNDWATTFMLPCKNGTSVIWILNIIDMYHHSRITKIDNHRHHRHHHSMMRGHDRDAYLGKAAEISSPWNGNRALLVAVVTVLPPARDLAYVFELYLACDRGG